MYYWKVGETLIAQYDSFDEARKDLDKQPMNVTIHIGDRTEVVAKEGIEIIPSDDASYDSRLAFNLNMDLDDLHDTKEMIDEPGN